MLHRGEESISARQFGDSLGTRWRGDSAATVVNSFPTSSPEGFFFLYIAEILLRHMVSFSFWQSQDFFFLSTCGYHLVESKFSCYSHYAVCALRFVFLPSSLTCMCALCNGELVCSGLARCVLDLFRSNRLGIGCMCLQLLACLVLLFFFKCKM